MEDVEAFEVASDGFRIAKPTMAAVLQAKIAYFGFEEGKVTGFCPAETDDPFAWNVKAAILSHLQADLESLRLPSESIEVCYNRSAQCHKVLRLEINNIQLDVKNNQLPIP